MKKILVLFAAVAIFATTIPVKAGGVYDGPEPGTHIIGVRLGLDHFLNVNAVYDYSLAKVWKGTFTIGGYAGIGFGLWGVYNDKNNMWMSVPIMARTTYRFNVIVPEWEVYGGVMLGVGLHIHNGIYPRFDGSFVVGTSYYFTEKFGVNLEFNGGTVSWANLGVKFKF